MDSKNIFDSLQLPTLSKTLLEIIDIEKRNPITFLDDVKKIVEKDPLLSAHILKVSNSSFYGFPQKIRTVSHAIGLLGIRKIKSLAFSFSMFDFLNKLDYKPVYGGTFNLILKKSLLTAACATILAAKTNYVNSEELYISGLLSEIGELLFFLHSPTKYCDQYTINDKKMIPRELDLFKIDHIKMGIDFCEHFNLPGFFKTSIINHFQLQQSDEPSKIIFVANQLAELLLTEDETEKINIFKDLENHTKRLLHLSLAEIDGSIKQLPNIMDTLTSEFPEMQKDLKRIIETGSNLIINLMKREMEMTIKTRELTESQKKLTKEKMFLTHMLNLSYFLSSLSSPLKIIYSIFEYFENFIDEFDIEFIYQFPGTDHSVLIRTKENLNGTPIDINKNPCLLKSKISNETVRLEKDEMEMLQKSSSLISLAFPISYHHNFFGFLILDVDKQDYLDFDMEMTYVQILANIVANSFQNFLSIEAMTNECNKKKMVTNELIKFDKKLHHSREALIELQKSEIMGELMPVIFHKLKNKLTPILGYSQILLTKFEDPSVIDKLKKIERNANDLTHQLNLLRDYFKPQRIQKENDNLNGIIYHLKPYFDQLERLHNVTICISTDSNVPDDLLNSGQIESLIINLVDNAVLAIKEKMKGRGEGVVDIRTEASPEGYKLVVSDNGIGIPEDNIPLIWTPFYTGFPEKSGIGLTICEKVIQNHGASAQVRSKEGQFTEIEISFAKTLLDEKTPLVDVPKTSSISPHQRILIVDDEPFLLELMKEILLTEGDFEIVTTTCGQEAIQLLSSNFNLVISDIRMPEVSGVQIYEFLKSKNLESKLIMVTADPFSEEVSLFLKRNKITYLKKPFELTKFKQYVLEKLT